MNKLIVLIMTVILMSTSTGCWDVRDVTNRVFVTSVGLDAAPDGYKVTIVIPKPASIKSRSTQVYSQNRTVEAESISMAVSMLQSELSGDISFSHLRILIIGEKLARQSNFNDLMSFFGKNPEIALRFRLMFVDGGEAEDVMKTIPFLDRSRTTELIGLGESGEDLGVGRSKKYFGFLGDLRQTDGNALGTRIIIQETDGKPVVSRIGGAIFTNWRLAGWLNPDEMQEANWILRQNPNIVVVHRVGNGQYSCQINTKSVKISPKINNGQIKFEINVKAIGNIAEQQGSSLDLTEPRNLKKLEDHLTKTILQQARRAVNRSQKELGIDYLGFDRALIKNDPELYKKLDWQKVYPTIPVEIKVDVHVPTVGVERR
jgi:spore germination protein KC